MSGMNPSTSSNDKKRRRVNPTANDSKRSLLEAGSKRKAVKVCRCTYFCIHMYMLIGCE